LENLDTEVNINRARETMRNCDELKKQKPWLNEGCSEFLNQGKEAK
jgi:hypothetical protein